MSTAAALEFSAAPYRHQVWRFVESQAAAATIRITDSLDEQARLEQLLDHSKPAWPAACAGLHYLLATPFRYAPYPKGSRFRAAGQRDGAFYASEEIDTAAAEAAFYLALFYAEAPSAQRPRAPVERTAFAVALTSARALDLTLPAFDARRAGLEHPSDYGASQALADRARAAGIELLRYRSARAAGLNVAVLSPAVFAEPAPSVVQTWHLFLRADLVQAWCENPRRQRQFVLADWAAVDERIC